MVLSETWFMEGYIDFELQKYGLLAYLKEVKQAFDETVPASGRDSCPL